MIRRPAFHRACASALVRVALALLLMCAVGHAEEIHGENSSFLGHGVAMVWGVLRGASEADTQVILRIARIGDAFAAVSLEGIDPFSQRREEFLGIRSLESEVEVRTPRATFADFPRREIHFYTANDRQTKQPTLIVYFMGLPDTTPEFATEAAVDGYLTETMKKLISEKGRMP